MSVHVIVDSASALPDEAVTAAGLRVVPLRLNIGSSSYPDGALSLDQVVRRLGDGIKTSAPSPGAWAQAYEAALADGEQVLVLTVSSEMSSSFTAAHLAAEGFDGRVVVVDSGTAAGAEGLIALAAASVAAAGGSIAEVTTRAEAVSREVRLVATVPALDQLVRSGRIPGLAGWAGRKIGVNPLFEFRRHEVHALRPALSRRAALDRIIQLVGASRPSDGRILRAAAMHAMAPDAAAHLRGELLALAPDGDVVRSSFSSVMVSHTGPGLAGVAWWWDAT